MALTAALSNSIIYFIQCATFAYGSKLLQNGEIEFQNVFKYEIRICVESEKSNRLFGFYTNRTAIEILDIYITKGN